MIKTKKVILKFGAPWCGPCRQLGPILSELKNEGLNIIEINTDEDPEIAEKYNIRSLPTLILIEDEKELNRIIGLKSKEEILEFYNL